MKNQASGLLDLKVKFGRRGKGAVNNRYNMAIYIALDRTPNKDCYWVGAIPKLQDISTPKPCPKYSVPYTDSIYGHPGYGAATRGSAWVRDQLSQILDKGCKRCGFRPKPQTLNPKLSSDKEAGHCATNPWFVDAWVVLELIGRGSHVCSVEISCELQKIGAFSAPRNKS